MDAADGGTGRMMRDANGARLTSVAALLLLWVIRLLVCHQAVGKCGKSGIPFSTRM